MRWMRGHRASIPWALWPGSGRIRPEPLLQDEFVIVQGVADLVALLPEEIWLVDFKTDAIKREEVAARAMLAP